MSRHPITLRLNRRAVSRADGLARLIRAVHGKVDPSVVSAFAFKNDELAFARRVLSRHARIWLFRVDQRRFAGDFVAVDMSCRVRERRRAWCLDLKRGAGVKLGGGGAGNAFVGVSAAIQEIARRTAVLAPDHPVVRATGDGRRLVEALFDVRVRSCAG